MKKPIIALGILLEICFLGFYLVKYLAQQWGVEKLFFKDPRVFGLVAIIFGLGLLIQIIAGIIVYKKEVAYKYILIFSIIFNLSLLFVWNIGSDDLYTHIQRGRMVAKYDISPYKMPYDNLKYDQFYSETKTVWSKELSIYGPVFTEFGAIVSYLAGDSLLTHVMVYKLVYSGLTILTGYLIYKITKSSLASLLFSWSPLVILEIQANNHLEILSVLPIVLAIYLVTSKLNWQRYILALSVLTLGSLTKYFGFVAYPFFILYCTKTLKTVKEKLLFLILGGLTQVVIISIAFLPFLDSVGILNGFFSLANGSFTSPSLAIVLVSGSLGLLGFKKEIGQTIVQSIYKIYYLFLVVKSFFAKFSDQKVFIGTLTLVFAGFTLVYLNLILPWYTFTLLALVAIYFGLTKEKKYIFFSYLISLYSFLLYIWVK